MKFQDSFHVPVPVSVAWDALTDIEKVYPCLPGAELTEVTDNEFHGLVTLKLGPITAVYKGVARFDSLDPENATLLIHAEGRDRHGQGTARARIHASLAPEGEHSTRVEMVNEVDITGKAAQFGRGIIADVSKEIMAQFAANLREVVVTPQGAESAPSSPAAHRGGSRPPEPVQGQSAISVASLAIRVVRNRMREQPVVTAALAAVPALVLVFVLRRILA